MHSGDQPAPPQDSLDGLIGRLKPWWMDLWDGPQVSGKWFCVPRGKGWVRHHEHKLLHFPHANREANMQRKWCPLQPWLWQCESARYQRQGLHPSLSVLFLRDIPLAIKRQPNIQPMLHLSPLVKERVSWGQGDRTPLIYQWIFIVYPPCERDYYETW